MYFSFSLLVKKDIITIYKVKVISSRPICNLTSLTSLGHILTSSGGYDNI